MIHQLLNFYFENELQQMIQYLFKLINLRKIANDRHLVTHTHAKSVCEQRLNRTVYRFDSIFFDKPIECKKTACDKVTIQLFYH